MFKAAIAAAIVAAALYVVWLTQDTVTWFAGEFAALLLLSVRVCGGTLVALLGAGALWMFLRQRHETRRQRDGAWAIEYHYLVSLPRRIWLWLCGRPIPKVRIDPNAYMGHALVIADAVYEVTPAAGWDRQLAYMADQERTNRVRAAAPGDGVVGLPWSNIQRGANGIANAATGRLLAGAYDPKTRPVTITQQAAPQLPAPPVEDITPADVVQASKPAQLVMGQTDGGELVRWDMAQNQHLRFHGSTQGSGKTNAIQTVAAAALKTGAHVVVCDRVDFKDWADFAHCAELVDTSDPAQLADVAARLLTIYHGRTRQLAKTGAKSITRYSGRMQRIVVVISEFGAQMDTARAEGIVDSVEQPLVELARLAGSTGIHLVAEDQAVKGWHRMLTTNLIPVIGRMPIYAAQACGYQGRGGVVTDTFPLGTFWHEGKILHTPNMEPVLRTLLADVPAPSQLVMLTPPWKVGERGSSQPVHSGANEPVQGQFTAVHPEVAPPPAAPVNYAPTTVEGWYEWTLDNYFPTHPELLQTDERGRGIGVKALGEAMAAENGKDYEAMKGTASEVAKRLRAEASLPGGVKLGVDTTSVLGGHVV